MVRCKTSSCLTVHHASHSSIKLVPCSNCSGLFHILLFCTSSSLACIPCSLLFPHALYFSTLYTLFHIVPAYAPLFQLVCLVPYCSHILYYCFTLYILFQVVPACVPLFQLVRLVLYCSSMCSIVQLQVSDSVSNTKILGNEFEPFMLILCLWVVSSCTVMISQSPIHGNWEDLARLTPGRDLSLRCADGFVAAGWQFSWFGRLRFIDDGQCDIGKRLFLLFWSKSAIAFRTLKYCAMNSNLWCWYFVIYQLLGCYNYNCKTIYRVLQRLAWQGLSMGSVQLHSHDLPIPDTWELGRSRAVDPWQGPVS